MAATTSTATCSANQKAIFAYFKPQPRHLHEKPYEILAALPRVGGKQIPQNNLNFEDVICPLEDIRGREYSFDLDTHGFAFRKLENCVTDFNDRNDVETRYLPQIEELLRRELGGNIRKIFCFDWRLRVSKKPEAPSRRDIVSENKLEPLQPAIRPHLDQSSKGAIIRCNRHFPDDAEDLLRGRFRIINVWQPLSPVTAWPLAVCDGRSVAPTDLVACDHIRQNHVGEFCFTKYNPQHKWMYLSKQTENEASLLKIYDSDESVQARFCVHSSFQFAGEGGRRRKWDGVRESVEVRAIVFDHPPESR